MPELGQLIIVTGTTGSGKTTTCGEFVAAADELWLHFGVDLFLGKAVPRKFVDGGPRSHEGVHMAPDDPNDPEGPAHLDLGLYGAGLLHAMNAMAATAVRNGQKIIMDHITTIDPPLLQDCVACLHELPVLFVALKPDSALLQKRIDARLPEIIQSMGEEHGRLVNEGTKRVSRYMFSQIFSHDCFDLVIDTGTTPPDGVVRAIAKRLDGGPGEAFATLAQRFAVPNAGPA
jgi:chloramphenicol 3-O-phosphotransferase